MRKRTKEKRVKAVPVSYDGGRHYVYPSVENAMDKTYPIVRPLYYYYDRVKTDEVMPFIKFIESAQGQEKTLELGFIPRQ